MLIPLNQIRQIYHAMLQSALEKESRGCTMYIFVSNDTDSLCALRIFTTILRQDEVRFVTIPVFSNTYLTQKIAEVRSMSEAVSSLVFINCGGNINLQKEWFYSEEHEDVKAYVIDSHRPILHMNVNDTSQKIIVIDDGCKSFAECPTHEDFQLYQELMRLEDEDEDEDGDELDSSDDEAGMEQKGLIDEDAEAEDNFADGAAREGGAQAGLIGGDGEIGIAEARQAIQEQREIEEAKQELDDLKGSDDGEAGYGDGIEGPNRAEGASQDVSDVMVGQKRPRDPAQDQETKALDLHKLKRQKKMQFMNYYRGTFYGKSCSAILYELAKQLNKVTNDILWLRIVGFYDQMLHQKIDQEEQDNETVQCQREVQLLVPDQIQYGAADENQLAGSEADGGDQPFDLFQLQLTSQSREIGHIKMETELKFMLLRHWTLYDSIQNSPYMVAKLNLAKEPGQMDLLRFLTHISVPLEEAKQQFVFMNPAIKRKFKEKIIDVASDFGLNDIMMTSFSRQVDAKTQLTATDMAYAISALLETPTNAQSADSENLNPNQMGTQGSTLDAAKDNCLDAIKNRLHDNFWVAYDALDLGQNNTHMVRRGISLAKEMQQAIVRVGNSLLEKKEIKIAQQFRYCILENSFLNDTKLFQYPLALVKLAHFIMECRKATTQRSKHQPLVISVKNVQKKTNLVVAVIGPNRDSETSRNDFNKRFQRVSTDLNLKTKHDGFDTAMIEMRTQDWPEFIQTLAELNGDNL